MKGVDLNLFKFDYDLTFAVLMMNPEGGIYSRFGTRDGKSATDRMSVSGLKNSMRLVLAGHRIGVKEAAVSPESRKSFTLTDIPAFNGSRASKEACYHCHFASNFHVKQLVRDGAFTKEKLFRFPLPENVGVTLDVDVSNRIKAVEPGSAAHLAGLRPGDLITRTDSTPVLTSADLQYALDKVSDGGSITLYFERERRPMPPAKLALTRGWRRTDISWRPSQEAVGPSVGIWCELVNPERRRQLGIPSDKLGLRVSFLFPGAEWAKTRGTLRMDDVLIGINGKELPAMNTRQFHSYFRLNFNVGDSVTLNVLRGSERLEIPVPCVQVDSE